MSNHKFTFSCSTSTALDYLSGHMWHYRLGHLAGPALAVLKSKLNLKNEHVLSCEVCHKAKLSCEPSLLSEHMSVCLGELIHMNVWGSYRVVSKDGYKFFLTIVDDFSRAFWVYMLKSKSEIFDCVVEFLNLLHKQFDKSVKIISGNEFVNKNMKCLLRSRGIVHQTSCHSPHQDDIVERKHKHFLSVARSLLFQSGVPLNMWSECVMTATYLINRTPSSVLGEKKSL